MELLNNMGVLNNIKRGVINATADVLSAPAKMRALRAKQQADSDVSILKTARAYKNAPNQANGGQAGMARSLASDIKDRLAKK